MSELSFSTRAEFRAWLIAHSETGQGVWLSFRKRGEPKTLTAQEALEEALCFGWIDGQMQSIDDTRYIKYFSQRRKTSKWSEKNKKLVAELAAKGLLTPLGQAKIDQAKQNGMWDAQKPAPPSDDHIAALEALLQGAEPAYTNYKAMSPSVRKTYAGFYFDAKSDDAKKRRLEKITARLHQNLKPM